MNTPSKTEPATFPIQRYFLLGASLVIMLIFLASIFLFTSGDAAEPPVDPHTPKTDIVFLGPSSAPNPNIMRLTIETGHIQKLTNVEDGVLEYTVSPDMQWIAYTRRVTGRITDIWLLNIETMQTIQLTNCREAQASCSTPSWRNDSQTVAYTRRELDPESGWAYTERVWLVDVASRQSRPLFDDFNVQGRYPVWSPTSAQIAFSLIDPSGILIYDFPSQETLFIPSQQGLTGIFTPDGQQFAYPALRFGQALQRYYTHIELVKLPQFGAETSDSPTVQRLSGELEAPIEEGQIAFHPIKPQAAIARRYLDSRYTQGNQLYLIDLNTKITTPLVVEADYNHAAISWHPTENWLLYQRNAIEDTTHIELWLFNIDTNETQLIYDDGFMPKFLEQNP